MWIKVANVVTEFMMIDKLNFINNKKYYYLIHSRLSPVEAKKEAKSGDKNPRLGIFHQVTIIG